MKFARRRSGKTDYRARKRLVVNDKNKYQSPRYRLVVRLTNHYVICQIVYSEIDGDKVLTSAYSSELPRYGVKVGLKNYAACYATGLLVARRLLDKLGMGDLYKGQTTVTGEVVKTKDDKNREYWVAKVEEGRRPFRAVLDVGIRPTTTGHRVFGALKGAVDGGLDIPHNHKRFPGYNPETKKYDSKFHRQRIMGVHLQEYMQTLEEEEPEVSSRRRQGLCVTRLPPLIPSRLPLPREDVREEVLAVPRCGPDLGDRRGHVQGCARGHQERPEARAALDLQAGCVLRQEG